MKISVEAWAPEYGAPTEHELTETDAPVDVTVERSEKRWEPLDPQHFPAEESTVLFTDGVRRVDARVWVEEQGGAARPGICASYAAGAVLCDGHARLVAADVQRGLFTATSSAKAIVCRHCSYPVRAAPGDSQETLSLALQQRMGELEVALAGAHGADLVIIDGPLTGRQSIPGAVGYVKTHRVSYLPAPTSLVVSRLESGQRSPLFLTMTSWSRFSWYVRLPGGSGHPWAAIVRCEVSADRDAAAAVRLADSVTALLPRYATALHKDARAPQNLYPIAGLERELRRRLGDAHLLYRELRSVAVRSS